MTSNGFHCCMLKTFNRSAFLDCNDLQVCRDGDKLTIECKEELCSPTSSMIGKCFQSQCPPKGRAMAVNSIAFCGAFGETALVLVVVLTIGWMCMCCAFIYKSRKTNSRSTTSDHESKNEAPYDTLNNNNTRYINPAVTTTTPYTSTAASNVPGISTDYSTLYTASHDYETIPDRGGGHKKFEVLSSKRREGSNTLSAGMVQMKDIGDIVEYSHLGDNVHIHTAPSTPTDLNEKIESPLSQDVPETKSKYTWPESNPENYYCHTPEQDEVENDALNKQAGDPRACSNPQQSEEDTVKNDEQAVMVTKETEFPSHHDKPESNSENYFHTLVREEVLNQNQPDSPNKQGNYSSLNPQLGESRSEEDGKKKLDFKDGDKGDETK